MSDGADAVRLAYDGPVAIVSYNRPEKHNAANDAMDARLFEILAELQPAPGPASGDLARRRRVVLVGPRHTQLGVRTEDISDLEFIERGHSGTQAFFTLPCRSSPRSRAG